MSKILIQTLVLITQAFLVEDDREMLIQGEKENGTRRRSFSDREGQRRELRGEVEQASYRGESISL